MIRRILLVIMAFMLTISFISCNSGDSHNHNSLNESFSEQTSKDTNHLSENEHHTTTTLDESEKLFLVTEDGRYVFSAYQNEGASNRNDTYKYKDYQNLTLVSSQKSQSYVDTTKDSFRTYHFEKKDVNIEYVKSFVSSNVDSSLNKFNNYDVYKDTSGATYFILTDTNQLIKYFNTTDVEQGFSIDIGKNRAVEISNAFITEHFGEDVLNNYLLTSVHIMFGEYWVSYMQYVHDYATTDEIIISINKDGSIAAFTGLNVSLYDNVSKDITLENIQNAEDQLLNALRTAELDNLHIVSKKVELDINGELYIVMCVTHGSNSQYADVFYLQVLPTE